MKFSLIVIALSCAVVTALHDYDANADELLAATSELEGVKYAEALQDYTHYRKLVSLAEKHEGYDEEVDLVDTLEKDKDLDLSQSGWGFVKKIKKKIAAKKKKRAAAGPKPCRFFCIMVKKARAAGVNKLLTQFVEPYLGEIAEKVGDKASCHVLEPIIADAIDKKVQSGKITWMKYVWCVCLQGQRLVVYASSLMFTAPVHRH